MAKAYLIVNFGGPRNQEEIYPFLRELLTDQDVVRSGWPQFWHNLLFSRIAKKRARQIAHDYALIGGASPIHRDTEEVRGWLQKALGAKVLAFHRYLNATHEDFIEEIERLDSEEVGVFPMFPQFSYATTGSVARWFDRHLSRKTVEKMKWVKSYPSHPAFVDATQKGIRNFLQKEGIPLADVFFLFSAHGLPQEFIDAGDPYEEECKKSYEAAMAGFDGVPSLLCYQSKFGKGEWLRPYTEEVSSGILQRNSGKPVVVVVPISFTSDHIETLFEIEHQYLPLIRRSGLQAYRCPAIGLQQGWLQAIPAILNTERVNNNTLFRS